MKRPIVLLICFLFVFSIAYAENSKDNQEDFRWKTKRGSDRQSILEDISIYEIPGPVKEQIRKYYHQEADYGKNRKKSNKKKSLPPGLRKKLARGGELPPGWQKKIARGEVLNADVYGNAYNLPNDLLRRLPHQPGGTELIEVEGKIIRVLEATRTILDVFSLNDQ